MGRGQGILYVHKVLPCVVFQFCIFWFISFSENFGIFLTYIEIILSIGRCILYDQNLFQKQGWRSFQKLIVFKSRFDCAYWKYLVGNCPAILRYYTKISKKFYYITSWRLRTVCFLSQKKLTVCNVKHLFTLQ